MSRSRAHNPLSSLSSSSTDLSASTTAFFMNDNIFISKHDCIFHHSNTKHYTHTQQYRHHQQPGACRQPPCLNVTIFSCLHMERDDFTAIHTTLLQYTPHDCNTHHSRHAQGYRPSQQLCAHWRLLSSNELDHIIRILNTKDKPKSIITITPFSVSATVFFIHDNILICKYQSNTKYNKHTQSS